jgi:DNA-binding NtrC family response regulator
MSTNPISPPNNRTVEPPAGARGSTATILVVEDDETVREFVRVALELAGYAVVTAADGGQGLAEYMTNPDRYDLLLSDVVMPNQTGPELVEIIRGIRPGVRVLFMSAYTGGTCSNPIEMPPGVPLLEKPFGIDRLLQAVSQAIS